MIKSYTNLERLVRAGAGKDELISQGGFSIAGDEDNPPIDFYVMRGDQSSRSYRPDDIYLRGVFPDGSGGRWRELTRVIHGTDLTSARGDPASVIRPEVQKLVDALRGNETSERIPLWIEPLADPEHLTREYRKTLALLVHNRG
jgi:hypothetical protein